MTTRKTVALTRWTFVGKVMSLFFNMLSRLVIAFLPRSKCLFNFMAAVTICNDFGAPQNKVCHCFHCFPSYLPWSDRSGYHDLSSFFLKPASSLSSFTFIKRLFSSSSLSAIRVVTLAYLRLLIYLWAILISAFASSSPAFWMMYSVYRAFPCGSASKESAYSAGNLGSIPGLRRSHGEGKGYPFQYSGLENSMNCIVHGVTKSQTQLSDFHFHQEALDFFTFCHKGGVICISKVIDISPGDLDSNLCFIQPSISHDGFCI